MQGLRRGPNMYDLNMPKYALISLSMPEHAWINCYEYAKVLNMPRYSYNNIMVIVTIILLEFLSAQFIHPGTLPPSYLF